MKSYYIYRNQAGREAWVVFANASYELVYYFMPNGALYMNKIYFDTDKYATVSRKQLMKLIEQHPEMIPAVINMLHDHNDTLHNICSHISGRSSMYSYLCSLQRDNEFLIKQLTMKQINLKLFVASYLNTAAWTTNDSLMWNKEFTKESMEKAKRDCENFIELVKAKLGEVEAHRLLTIEGNDLTYQAPHDFWLTRNGHGAGFWDRPEVYGEVEAKVLTEIAKSCGVCECDHLRGPRSKLTFL